MKWKNSMLSFANPSLLNPLLSSFDSEMDMYCFCLPSAHPFFWSSIPVSLWGTIPDWSTWVMIKWGGHVSSSLCYPNLWPQWSKSVMCSELVSPLRFIPEVFVRNLGKKEVFHLRLMRRYDIILIDFPLPVTSDKNKSDVDLVICLFNLISEPMEATLTSLEKSLLQETNTREIRLERWYD